MTSPNAEAPFVDRYRQARQRLGIATCAAVVPRSLIPPAPERKPAKRKPRRVRMPKLPFTQQAILARLIYSLTPVPSASIAHGVDANAARVHVCALRRNVRRLGVVINLERDRGYCLGAGCRDTARKILEAQA